MEHSVKNNSNGGRLYSFSPRGDTSSLSPNLINLSYNLTHQYILFVSAYFHPQKFLQIFEKNWDTSLNWCVFRIFSKKCDWFQLWISMYCNISQNLGLSLDNDFATVSFISTKIYSQKQFLMQKSRIQNTDFQWSGRDKEITVKVSGEIIYHILWATTI